MLAMKDIRNDVDRVRTALKNRRSEFDLDALLSLDDKRRSILSELEALRNRKNVVSKEVGRLKKEGLDASGVFEEMRQVGVRTGELEAEFEHGDWPRWVGVSPDSQRVVATGRGRYDVPSAANVQAYSLPITPAPTTASLSGNWSRCRIVSES